MDNHFHVDNIDTNDIRSEILKAASKEKWNKCASIIAIVMEVFSKRNLVAGDIIIENCIKELVKENFLISDDSTENFASYKIMMR